MWQVINGNNVDVLRTYPDNTFDSIITDPPYGIDFLGKSWDANVGALETYQECLRVLKPGGHILAFSAARTYHHLAVTLEQAGFEIRDQIMWIYSSGFPKSQDVGRTIQRSLGVKETVQRKKTDGYNINNQREFSETHVGYEQMKPIAVCTDPEAKVWEGWGTALKPAHEPICLARKPLDKDCSIARNCQRWGVGAVNIDATRIAVDGPDTRSGGSDGWNCVEFGEAEPEKYDGTDYEPNALGRFPSNVIGDIPDYQKYFYCPKVSKAERHMGFDQSLPGHWEMAQQMGGSLIDHQGNPCRSANKAWLPGIGEIYTHGLSKHYLDWCKQQGITVQTGNNHPTVKPIELMKYLIKLVTPEGGHVLDPFNGSGSTGCAAVELGYDYTGIELDLNYVAIAQRRIQAREDQHKSGTTFEELFE